MGGQRQSAGPQLTSDPVPLVAASVDEAVYIGFMSIGKVSLRPPSADVGQAANHAGPTRVVVCADDYGLSPGIGVAIRDLLQRGRLSATSAMTAGPYWPSEAARLKSFIGQADLGLHLTLTDQTPIGPCPRLAPDGRLPSLPALATASLTGRLPLGEIEAEAHRQIDRFEEYMGHPPDHLDGHQHAHSLPGIDQVVLRVAQARLPKDSYIRATDAPLRFLLGAPSGVRAAIIALLGQGLSRGLKRAGIKHNARFAGVRGFDETAPYLELFAAALKPGGPDLLIMCHPGMTDSILPSLDSVVAQREVEYRALKSPALADLLTRHDVYIGRFNDKGRTA